MLTSGAGCHYSLGFIQLTNHFISTIPARSLRLATSRRAVAGPINILGLASHNLATESRNPQYGGRSRKACNKAPGQFDPSALNQPLNEKRRCCFTIAATYGIGLSICPPCCRPTVV
ncbi:hypothetical protein CgunFtcFv8_015858 [Champsocephalus gunnari]|uniref:Uncharacterized protein n=1 Tax=Champsocephalus gunnari TaxID=52237 RepID=A0AAN8C6J2_CHAGU|nr:hypothetical protein CgunFtcFv8_015858 [Champsocephalus gunnari]